MVLFYLNHRIHSKNDKKSPTPDNKYFNNNSWKNTFLNYGIIVQ